MPMMIRIAALTPTTTAARLELELELEFEFEFEFLFGPTSVVPEGAEELTDQVVEFFEKSRVSTKLLSHI
jgi:hypothetical protein